MGEKQLAEFNPHEMEWFFTGRVKLGRYDKVSTPFILKIRRAFTL